MRRWLDYWVRIDGLASLHGGLEVALGMGFHKRGCVGLLAGAWRLHRPRLSGPIPRNIAILSLRYPISCDSF